MMCGSSASTCSSSAITCPFCAFRNRHLLAVLLRPPATKKSLAEARESVVPGHSAAAPCLGRRSLRSLRWARRPTPAVSGSRAPLGARQLPVTAARPPVLPVLHRLRRRLRLTRVDQQRRPHGRANRDLAQVLTLRARR